ncbi:MAG: transposase [Magnetococcales bacterium]|nr:transposase [Magnetococcales bacterium]
MANVGKCYETAQELRWPHGTKCPHCHAIRTTRRGCDEVQPARQDTTAGSVVCGQGTCGIKHYRGFKGLHQGTRNRSSSELLSFCSFFFRTPPKPYAKPF